MRDLEAELGARLFERTPQGIQLTTGGEAFFARVRVADAELRKARSEVAQIASADESSVDFRVGPTTGVLVVPEAVARFRKQFPRTPVRILEGFGQFFVPLIRDGTLDFAVGVRLDRQSESVLTFKPLFRQELVVVARKAHPLRKARSLKQLADSEWLTLTPYGSEAGPADRIFASARLPSPRHSLQCESYNVFVALLAQTDLLGIISTTALAQPLARERLERIHVRETLPSYTTGLFTRKGTQLSPPAAALAKAVVSVARRLTAGRS